MNTGTDNLRTDAELRARNMSANVEHAAEQERNNPASLSANPNKKVATNKPHVKPPFIDVPMGRFLTYLTLALAAVSAFYIWRVTVWASEVGGYWNLLTGRRDTADIAQLAAQNAASAAGSGLSKGVSKGAATGASAISSRKSKGTARPSAAQEDDVQSLVWKLAEKLGVKPADVSNALRHLVDPTAPQPGAAAGAGNVADQAAAAAAAKAAEASASAAADEPGLLNVVGEILLD